MTLSAMGEAETPAGGSVCMRCGNETVSIDLHVALESVFGCQGASVWPTLKSRIRRRRADVDMLSEPLFARVDVVVGIRKTRLFQMNVLV